MRIGIVSDIHCNAAGLEQALTRMGNVDELVCAGDAIYQYRFSNEVVRLLRERGARVIRGNHEEVFFGRDGVRARAAAWIDHDLAGWLGTQPFDLRTRVNGKVLYVVHGSPWDPFKEYLYPTSPTLSRFQDFDADLVILGHTHYQMATRVGRTLLINPGSAGEPRDPRNGCLLSCAVLDTQTDEVTFLDYPDPTRVIADAGTAR